MEQYDDLFDEEETLEEETTNDSDESAKANDIRSMVGTGDNLIANFLSSFADQLQPSADDTNIIWKPLEGPQTMAFYSKADELFYGGAAGGGKTDLMIGLSLSRLSPHKNAICFRRSYPEHKHFISRAKQVLADSGYSKAQYRDGNVQSFVGLPDNKVLEIGSAANFLAAQKYKGRPHDLKLFDEVPDIPEEVYTFLIGWARTAQEGVPVRVVVAGNPPTTTEGRWVIRRWSPWLDPKHKNPALPGELRWFATLDGNDVEITKEISPEGAEGKPFQYTEKNGNVLTVRPKSRTFVPAKLSDNPFLSADGEYEAVLQNMPEPFRSQMLNGDFSLSSKPDPWQLIPDAWIDRAEKRYEEALKEGAFEEASKLTPVYGLDVSEMGGDITPLVKITGKYVQWTEEIEVETLELAKVPILQANEIIRLMNNNKEHFIFVDAIGVGLAVIAQLKSKGYRVIPIKGSNVSRAKDKDGLFGFFNKRTELWWRLREALDPEGDDLITMPISKKLRRQLTSIKFERTINDVIKVERKEVVRKRIGESPDLAESLMLALYAYHKTAGGISVV